jgi:hypothetical protein
VAVDERDCRESRSGVRRVGRKIAAAIGVTIIAMNPMFYATFAYVAFSGFFVIGGLWLAHGIKKDRRKRHIIDFTIFDSRSRSSEPAK